MFAIKLNLIKLIIYGWGLVGKKVLLHREVHLEEELSIQRVRWKGATGDLLPATPT